MKNDFELSPAPAVSPLFAVLLSLFYDSEHAPTA
jgi:hypothetical protein